MRQPDAVRRAQRVDMPAAGFSLLFDAGARPQVSDVARLLSNVESGIAARVSHRPAPEEGWAEILMNGLTFDLRGLSPAVSAGVATALHYYGVEDGGEAQVLEPVELVPAEHVAAAGTLQPVIRALAGLAANLVLHLPVKAVVWHPARTFMEPRYFSRIVLNWLSGGAFPALGLTALVPGEGGGVSSNGLAHFIGQEMQLEKREGEDSAEAVKLAIRLVDHLVGNGPLKAPRRIKAGREVLLAEPSHSGKYVWVSRAEA